MYCQIHCSNSSPILELPVKFVYQICHENINKLLDGAYLANLGIDIKKNMSHKYVSKNIKQSFLMANKVKKSKKPKFYSLECIL